MSQSVILRTSQFPERASEPTKDPVHHLCHAANLHVLSHKFGLLFGLKRYKGLPSKVLHFGTVSTWHSVLPVQLLVVLVFFFVHLFIKTADELLLVECIT